MKKLLLLILFLGLGLTQASTILDSKVPVQQFSFCKFYGCVLEKVSKEYNEYYSAMVTTFQLQISKFPAKLELTRVSNGTATWIGLTVAAKPIPPEYANFIQIFLKDSMGATYSINQINVCLNEAEKDINKEAIIGSFNYLGVKCSVKQTGGSYESSFFAFVSD